MNDGRYSVFVILYISHSVLVSIQEPKMSEYRILLTGPLGIAIGHPTSLNIVGIQAINILK